MNNLRKFSTEADYSAATLNYPAVSWVTATDNVYFNKTAPAAFSGLTVYYNITDISQPTELFNGGGGGSGSGSGSGSGGALPSAMIIDGTAVEVANTYQFSTTGEHIVNYSFEDNQIPGHFLDDGSSGRFSTVTKVEIGDTLTSIGFYAFIYCTGLTSVTIGDGVTYISEQAFFNCSSLTSVTIGNGVSYIEPEAFNQCTSLESITSNAMTAPTLTYGVFNGTSDYGVLTVPSGSQGYCGWIGSELSGYWTIEGVTCE